MLFVSGSQFLRRELSAMLSFSFSGMAEKFLKINANQVGNKRKLYSWHVLSDRKLGEFTGLLDRRAETTQFAASLPAMLIPALVAHFDTFILRTLNDILKHKPEIAKSIQKTITAQELLEFPNIEVARAALIDKDLDSLMRDSHDKHLKWISDKIGVEIQPEKDLAKIFFELCERRNILTHNDGIVNSTYLNNCRRHKIDVTDLSEGDKLDTDATYFSQAINCIIEMATKISQVTWRRLAKQEIELSDNAINKLCYELIRRKRYKLAINIFDFCRKDIKKWSSDTEKLQNIINHANALRLSENTISATKILNTEDWSSRALNFQMCAKAIEADYDGCTELLLKHGDAIGIHRIDYAEWPVFIGLRDHTAFLSAFEKVFRESLIDEIIADAQPKREDNNQKKEKSLKLDNSSDD
jgi:hypothetical protein